MSVHAPAVQERGDADAGASPGPRTVEGYIGEMKRIDGWLSRSDAWRFAQVDEAQKAAGIEGDLVEIGTWHGRGAILFHHLLRESEKAFAVDIFDLRKRSHPYFNDPVHLRSHAASFGCDGRLVEVRMDTARHGHRLLDAIGTKCARMVHVDGGHDYAVVRRDIEIVSRLLHGGSVLVFDDFFNRRHPGTTQAIMEFLLASREYAPFMLTTKKLWVCRLDRHDWYSERLRSTGIAYGRTVLFNSKVLLDPAIGSARTRPDTRDRNVPRSGTAGGETTSARARLNSLSPRGSTSPTAAPV